MDSFLLQQPKKNTFAVLDLGSSKIVCMIVYVNNDGTPQVIGHSHFPSSGIKCGSITNAIALNKIIKSTINIAERESNTIVDGVYINISCIDIQSSILPTSIEIGNREITAKDIKRMILQANQWMDLDNEVIIHNTPISFALDKIQGILDPIGMYGKQLDARMYILSCQKSLLQNLEHCFDQLTFSLKGCAISAYTSGLACLSKDDLEMGAIIVDIGSNSISIGGFLNNHLIYTDIIPLGGANITKDLAFGLNISMELAEKIKILHGRGIVSSYDNTDRFISIDDEHNNNNERDQLQFNQNQVTHILQPRLEEIFELIEEKVSQYEQLEQRKLVITGGSAQLPGMREIAYKTLNRPIKIGLPKKISFNNSGYNPDYYNPAFSSIIGLIVLITEEFYNKNTKGVYDNFFNKAKAIFRNLYK